ncbi:MAG: RHS repeat protein, partial [Fimbriimonadaceae bacterium]|nr:RHS repeat protein [Fimbriimonadaceae bacterium]
TEAVSYEYDALYRQTLLTDGNGHSTIFRYDSKGRLALIRCPLASGDSGADTVRFTLYDDAGRLLRRIDGRDIVTEYDYDEPGGALTAIRYPAYPAQDVAFTYDALGRRVGMTDATGEHVYSYDDGGRLLAHEVTYTGLDPQTIAYEYYPNGSRSKLTTPAGEHDYTYDAGGRLTALEYGLGTAEWTYLDNGALATQTLPNGAVTSYDYNVANQLVGLLNQAPDSSTISSYGTMTYRGTGDLATITSTIPGASSLAGVVDYGYDTKRQLTLEDSTRDGGYDFANAFDSAGNATTFRDATQTFNANNQLTGPGTYVYDGNGNPTTFGGTALTWDVENRMTAHGTALTAAYRGDGLRAWKEGSTRTYFLYDGINVVCELDAVGDLLAASTFGAAGLLSRGAVQYQFDPLGDAVHLLDAAGDVTATRLFDAWGNELTSGGFNPRGYRAKYGYYTDEETGLVALAYRYYVPGVGRFLNRDPIGSPASVNLQAYVANRPLSQIDADGLQARRPCADGAFSRGECYMACTELGPNDLIVKACFAICESLKRLVCDDLWWRCFTIKSKRGAEICLLLYDIICLHY